MAAPRASLGADNDPKAVPAAKKPRGDNAAAADALFLDAKQLCSCKDIEDEEGCVAKGTNLLNDNPEEAESWNKHFNKSGCACDDVTSCTGRKPLCATCAEALADESKHLAICEESKMVRDALVGCVCLRCTQDCGVGWCTTGDTSQPLCLGCIADLGGQNCAAARDACLADQ